MTVLDVSAITLPSHGTSEPAEMTALFEALTRLRRGDASVRLPLDWTGVAGKVADAFNEVVELNDAWPANSSRLSRVVGKEGKLKQRASLRRRRAASGASRSTRSTR